MTVDAEFPLTVGVQYVAYAFTVFEGHTWFFVLDDDDRGYPVWYPATVFDVTDPSIPADWVFGYVRSDDDEDGEQYLIVSFPEWALHRLYYDGLVSGDPEAVATFAHRRVSAERP